MVLDIRASISSPDCNFGFVCHCREAVDHAQEAKGGKNDLSGRRNFGSHKSQAESVTLIPARVHLRGETQVPKARLIPRTDGLEGAASFFDILGKRRPYRSSRTRTES